jgi:hypothetical protein
MTDIFDREFPLEHILGCVGKGWHSIVTRLISDLKELGWDGNLNQIKEKFGGLRFYIGAGTKEIYDRIAKAGDESLKTCEMCGKLGKPRGTWYVKTLCAKCFRRGQKG